MNSLIEAQDVRKSFTTEAGELRVLKGVSIAVSEGEMVGIIGASGVGKSTLLHTSGKVYYHNKDILSLDGNALASFRNRTVGFVFQFHHLLPEFTALENVAMPGLINRSQKSEGRRDYREITKKAEMLLDEMGLSERKRHRPGELSGGEQQRVAVARALMLEPKVVLADEPTGNLDAVTGEDLFNILKNLNREKGITFVIVTHNESLSDRCHRVLRMVDGSIA
jgi:lipoprotein-releasing system ATP-binding protein